MARSDVSSVNTNNDFGRISTGQSDYTCPSGQRQGNRHYGKNHYFHGATIWNFKIVVVSLECYTQYFTKARNWRSLTPREAFVTYSAYLIE